MASFQEATNDNRAEWATMRKARKKTPGGAPVERRPGKGRTTANSRGATTSRKAVAVAPVPILQRQGSQDAGPHPQPSANAPRERPPDPKSWRRHFAPAARARQTAWAVKSLSPIRMLSRPLFIRATTIRQIYSRAPASSRHWRRPQRTRCRRICRRCSCAYRRRLCLGSPL